MLKCSSRFTTPLIVEFSYKPDRPQNVEPLTRGHVINDQEEVAAKPLNEASGQLRLLQRDIEPGPPRPPVIAGHTKTLPIGREGAEALRIGSSAQPPEGFVRRRHEAAELLYKAHQCPLLPAPTLTWGEAGSSERPRVAPGSRGVKANARWYLPPRGR